MSDSTTLSLGSFTFLDFEIPETIPFGLEQRLAVKKLVGGARVVDAMGADPVDITWSGRFLGQNALARANSLKAMAQSGKQWTLTWNKLKYVVVVGSYHPDFHRSFDIPYTITCVVVADNSTAVPLDSPNATAAINSDLSTATNLCSTVGNAGITAGVSTLTTTMNGIPDLAKVGPTTVSGIYTPLTAVQTQVSALISSNEAKLAVSSVAGLVPGASVPSLVAQITSYAGINTQQTALIQLQGVLGRIGVNLGQVNSSVRTVTVAGGNLMDIAAKQYGNPMGYTAILAANPALKGDPQLTGVTTLVIPPYVNKTDGVRQ